MTRRRPLAGPVAPGLAARIRPPFEKAFTSVVPGVPEGF